MNTLLFTAGGFALLSFFKSGQNKKSLPDIFREVLQVFFGVFLFVALSFPLRAFFHLRTAEVELLLAVIFFAVILIMRRETLIFMAVCGLGFWILEYDTSLIRIFAGALSACFIYIAFRFALWCFQNKSLFHKPPHFFAGHSVPIVQAFWTSVILTVLMLLFT